MPAASSGAESHAPAAASTSTATPSHAPAPAPTSTAAPRHAPAPTSTAAPRHATAPRAPFTAPRPATAQGFMGYINAGTNAGAGRDAKEPPLGRQATASSSTARSEVL